MAKHAHDFKSGEEPPHDGHGNFVGDDGFPMLHPDDPRNVIPEEPAPQGDN